MNILGLIFANGWTILGTTVLTVVVLNGVTELVKAFGKGRTVTVTTYGDKTRIVKIENAEAEDVREAVGKHREPERDDDLEVWE